MSLAALHPLPASWLLWTPRHVAPTTLGIPLYFNSLPTKFWSKDASLSCLDCPVQRLKHRRHWVFTARRKRRQTEEGGHGACRPGGAPAQLAAGRLSSCTRWESVV